MCKVTGMAENLSFLFNVFNAVISLGDSVQHKDFNILLEGSAHNVSRIYCSIIQSLLFLHLYGLFTVMFLYIDGK